MPVIDKYRPRTVYIEGTTGTDLSVFPYPDRFSLILVSTGSTTIEIDESIHAVTAPCVICISPFQKMKVQKQTNIHYQFFNFDPVFVNSNLTFKNILKNDFEKIEDMHDRNMMTLFLEHTDNYNGIIPLDSQLFITLSNWLNTICSEILMQSDGKWTCRIRRYLLQSLYMLDDIKETSSVSTDNIHNYINSALEYIHTHYQSTITLDDLCEVLHTNKTTLNKYFKMHLNTTVSQYIITYRLKLSVSMLEHTNLNTTEISDSCGFCSPSYFTNVFEKKYKVTPGQYRNDYKNNMDKSTSTL